MYWKDRSMKLRIATLALGMVMGLSMIGGAAAGVDAIGTPGERNCEGQTRAFVAQASKEQFGEPGLGNFVDFAGLSVKELQELVRAFCAEEL